MNYRSVWIGFDPRETAAFAVAAQSAARYMTVPMPIYGIVLRRMQAAGFYTRAVEQREGRLWDPISEAPMSTEFAISRFLTPLLAKSGMALFMDCDVLIRGNLCRLFDRIDRTKAVTVVKHHHVPPEGTKMDGQIQTRYARKNWSSVMMFNCDHPSNRALTLDLINSVPGRDLHGFCWLQDDEIGELPVEYNWLVGHSPIVPDPQIVHFTDGIPLMAGYENVDYSDEWNVELDAWAGGNLSTRLLMQSGA